MALGEVRTIDYSNCFVSSYVLHHQLCYGFRCAKKFILHISRFGLVVCCNGSHKSTVRFIKTFLFQLSHMKKVLKCDRPQRWPFGLPLFNFF